MGVHFAPRAIEAFMEGRDAGVRALPAKVGTREETEEAEEEQRVDEDEKSGELGVRVSDGGGRQVEGDRCFNHRPSCSPHGTSLVG